MIHENERKYIFSNMYSSEHFFELDTFILGEAFLENDCIIYKKSELMTIVFHPFSVANFDSDKFSNYWLLLKQKHIKQIDAIGNLSLLPDLALTSVLKSEQYFLSSDEFIMNSKTPKKSAVIDYKKCIKNGYRLEYCIGIIHSTVHKALLNFISSKQTNLHDSDYAFYKHIPYFLNELNFEVVIAKKNFEMIGLCFLYHATEKIKYALLYFSITSHKNVSDFILGNLLDKYQGCDIYLGPSVSPGIKAFKTKWATETPVLIYKQSFYI